LTKLVLLVLDRGAPVGDVLVLLGVREGNSSADASSNKQFLAPFYMLKQI
jgi:hypothetical protein